MSSKSVFIILLSFTLALQLGCIAAEGKLDKFSKFHVRNEINVKLVYFKKELSYTFIDFRP